MRVCVCVCVKHYGTAVIVLQARCILWPFGVSVCSAVGRLSDEQTRLL